MRMDKQRDISTTWAVFPPTEGSDVFSVAVNCAHHQA